MLHLNLRSLIQNFKSLKELQTTIKFDFKAICFTEIWCTDDPINQNLPDSSFHVTYAFQSESTLYSSLNVKELLALNRYKIWSLSECNWTRTQNHLVRKWTLNHLANLTSWDKCFSVRLRTKWFWVRVYLQSLKSIFLQFRELHLNKRS